MKNDFLFNCVFCVLCFMLFVCCCFCLSHAKRMSMYCTRLLPGTTVVRLGWVSANPKTMVPWYQKPPYHRFVSQQKNTRNHGFVVFIHPPQNFRVGGCR